MRTTIQMKLKLTKTSGPLHKYNCMVLEDNIHYMVGPFYAM